MLPSWWRQVKKKPKFSYWRWRFGLSYLQYLATAGVGTIGIVDFDTIEIHNLHRQILYTEDQVGLSKLKLPKRLCKLNPLIEVIAIPEKVTENAVTILDTIL
jgi:adenylyltransferase/sulfurtransferase